MTKLAHLVSRPGHQIGDRVLALCSKEFKVKVLWDDIPDDKPICRFCVNVALEALTEADATIEAARMNHLLTQIRVKRMGEGLNPEAGLILDGIAERDGEHQDAQLEKKRAKEDEARAKTTCTCTWETMEDFVVDPDCPIHGKGLDLTEELIEEPSRPTVEPPKEEK